MKNETVFKTLPEGVTVNMDNCEGGVSNGTTGMMIQVLLRSRNDKKDFHVRLVTGVTKFIWSETRVVFFNSFGVTAIYDAEEFVGWDPLPGQESEDNDDDDENRWPPDDEKIPDMPKAFVDTKRLPDTQEIDIIDEIHEPHYMPGVDDMEEIDEIEIDFEDTDDEDEETK